jgi:hypothetical protein
MGAQEAPDRPNSLHRRALNATGHLFVIVLGVTLALAADSWRESAVERRLEESFLDRLVDDLETQLAEFEESREDIGHVMAHGLAILPYVNGDGSEATPIGIIGSAYQASRSNATIELVDHTYVELLSTGGLGVITDPEIRAAVVNFYRRYAYGRPDELRANHNAGYYNAVRGRLPVEVQQMIREVMNTEDTVGCGLTDSPLHCHLEVDERTAAAAAAALVDPEVARSLNLWMQSLVNELTIADIYDDIVREVLATIDDNRR